MLRKLRRLSQFLLRLALVCLALSVVVFLVSTPSQLTPRQKGDTLISVSLALLYYVCMGVPCKTGLPLTLHTANEVCGVCSQGCYILILVAMKCVVCVVCAGQGCYILILVAMKCVVCAVRAVTNFGCSCVPA